MFVICAQCHKVTAEAEPLLNFDARYTLCNACYHLAKLEYYKMLNDFYLEKEQVLKTGIDTYPKHP